MHCRMSKREYIIHYGCYGNNNINDTTITDNDNDNNYENNDDDDDNNTTMIIFQVTVRRIIASLQSKGVGQKAEASMFSF